ncbi:hypothetical protein GE061_018222 [Apolygus lucorum]|uniref:Uncharacterized protein n=1 Tax=Apolygus lucorum TaxID=248454 RepID=A0A8S9XHB3_APOLU|nr:hypothetical protein GE061_018222 [Apolygus lucorum]
MRLIKQTNLDDETKSEPNSTTNLSMTSASLNQAVPSFKQDIMLRNPISKLFSNWGSSILQNTQSQVRYKWTDWRMAKDVRKRKTLAENAVQKLRINALRKNDILPKEIREIADKQITELPRDAVGIRIRGRCAITSRPRGNVLRWRRSKILDPDRDQMSLILMRSRLLDPNSDKGSSILTEIFDPDRDQGSMIMTEILDPMSLILIEIKDPDKNPQS